MLKSIKNEKESIEYYFKYLVAVSKIPLKIDNDVYDNNVTSLNNILISELYFRDYDCLKYRCSNCCYRFCNIYTMDHFNKLNNKINKNNNKYISIKDIYVNNSSYSIAIENHTELQNNKACMHLNDPYGCKLELDLPIHCMFPLIKLKLKDSKLLITKQSFGRRHTIPCPIGAKEFVDVTSDKFYIRCIYPFEILKENCEYFHINNWCDEIIIKIKSSYEDKFGSKINNILFE